MTLSCWHVFVGVCPQEILAECFLSLSPSLVAHIISVLLIECINIRHDKTTTNYVLNKIFICLNRH